MVCMCFYTKICNLVVPCGRSRSVGVFIILLIIILKKKTSQWYIFRFIKKSIDAAYMLLSCYSKQHDTGITLLFLNCISVLNTTSAICED